MFFVLCSLFYAQCSVLYSIHTIYSLRPALRSLLSALYCWGAWGAWELILQIKSLTWKLFLGGQGLLSALCSLLSALRSLSAFCSLLSAFCSPLSLLSALFCWESESKALLGNCFLEAIGCSLLSGPCSLLLGGLGGLGAHSPN